VGKCLAGADDGGREHDMIDIQHGLKQVASRERWAARGASFMVKVKATKAVWFPPEPAKSGQRAATAGAQAASAGAQATGRTTKRATKKAAGKPASTTSGAVKKASGGTKKKASAAKTAAKKTSTRKTSKSA
jgi:hypothetical protein